MTHMPTWKIQKGQFDRTKREWARASRTTCNSSTSPAGFCSGSPETSLRNDQTIYTILLCASESIEIFLLHNTDTARCWSWTEQVNSETIVNQKKRKCIFPFIIFHKKIGGGRRKFIIPKGKKCAAPHSRDKGAFKYTQFWGIPLWTQLNL